MKAKRNSLYKFSRMFIFVWMSGLLCVSAFAQGSNKFSSSKVQKYVKQGDTAYKKEQFVIAFDRYMRAYKEETASSAKQGLTYRLGNTQYALNHAKEAYLYYKDLWDSGWRDPEFVKIYGDVLMQLAMYKDAEIVFSDLSKAADSSVWEPRLRSAKRGLSYDKKEALLNPSQLIPQTEINTPFSEYGLALMEGKLVFASARPKGESMDPRTGQGYSHLYTATYNKITRQWGNIENMPSLFNPSSTGVGTFSFDTSRNIAYFQWSKRVDGLNKTAVYTSTRQTDGSWGEPQEFLFNGVEGNTGHPAISPDGNSLLFIIKANGGQGGADIWMMKRIPQLKELPKKKSTRRTTQSRTTASKSKKKVAAGPIVRNPDWEQPFNLGKNVNTLREEVFPIWIDAKTFSFSSDGHEGYGGLDVFVATLDSAQKEILNVNIVEPPINSSFDDYSLLLNGGFKEVFFVSNRFERPGRTDDIYAFPKTAGLVKIKGDVRDAQTEEPIKKYIVYIKDSKTGKTDTVKPDRQGQYEIRRKEGAHYEVSIKKDDYISEHRIVSFPDAVASLPIILSQTENFTLYEDTLLYTPVSTEIDPELLATFDSLSRPIDSLILQKDSTSSTAMIVEATSANQATAPTAETTSANQATAPTAETTSANQATAPTAEATSANQATAPTAETTPEGTLQGEYHHSNRLSVDGDLPSQDLSAYMRDGISSGQIIDGLNKNRKDYEYVDERMVEDYKERINDPSRRNRLQVLPAGSKCDQCEEKEKRRNVSEPFYVRSGDDKALITLTDNAGNSSYIDIAPNAAYEFEISQIQFGGGGPALPRNIENSDVRKTVNTKDYVLYECAPKLSEIGDETYVNNVYYDFGKADIVKDGFRELDRLIIIGLKNPSMKFEVGSHADERGGNEVNDALTQNRLTAVTNYISKKGFDMDRVVGKAYGKKVPLLKNAQTEEEHRLNRRTTFRLFLPQEELQDEIKVQNEEVSAQIARNETPTKKYYPVLEQKPEPVETVRYRIQLGAYRHPVENPNSYFTIVTDNIPSLRLSYYYDGDGMYKYSVGNYISLDEARKIANQILELGQEVYIAAYYAGKRITIAESRIINKRNARR